MHRQELYFKKLQADFDSLSRKTESKYNAKLSIGGFIASLKTDLTKVTGGAYAPQVAFGNYAAVYAA